MSTLPKPSQIEIRDSRASACLICWHLWPGVAAFCSEVGIQQVREKRVMRLRETL